MDGHLIYRAFKFGDFYILIITLEKCSQRSNLSNAFLASSMLNITSSIAGLSPFCSINCTISLNILRDPSMIPRTMQIRPSTFMIPESC